ncbi:hypothetical protein RB195_026525 [Necator americanus]|uniref:Secreted protein n=1 Tax=Necator americanus TaxID=51031 RepID=A0ABR1EXB1_NECAM
MVAASVDPWRSSLLCSALLHPLQYQDACVLSPHESFLSTADAVYSDVSMSRSDGDAVGRLPLQLRLPLLLLPEIFAECLLVSRASAVVASLVHECPVSRPVIGSNRKQGDDGSRFRLVCESTTLTCSRLDRSRSAAS